MITLNAKKCLTGAAATVILSLCTGMFSAQAQTASTIIPKTVNRRDTARQTDLIDIGKSLFHIKPGVIRTEKDKKIYFSILPVSSAVPGGTGRALVTSTSAGTYLGPRKTTNLSSASFAPYWNFGSRFGLPLRTSIWLPENTWTIQGDIRFLRYPQNSWGLGSERGEDDLTLVNYNYFRFYQAALKKIKPYLFAGFGYNLDYHWGIRSDDENVILRDFTKYNYGVDKNSVSSGVTANIVYDTRNNSINPLPGAYANVIYRVNPTFLGSNDFSTSLYVDVRKYIRLNPAKRIQQNTLAFWSYIWSASKKTPYLDLPSVGWDPYNRSGRGFDQNRYRGHTLVYLEAEYRRDITANGLLGFVVFSNVNSVSGSGSLLTSYHPAAGAGLRVKFNKASGTNIAVDYGMSKGFKSLSLGLGEAF